MKKCLYCGAQIADDSRFCTECGKKVMQTNVCPHCGAGVGDSDAFCYNCGKNLANGSSGFVPNEEVQQETYEEEESSLKKVLRIILGVLAVAIVGAGGWYGYKEYSAYNEKKFAREKFVADSLEQVRKDSIRLAEQKEQKRIEAEKVKKFKESFTFNNFLSLLENFDKASFAQKCGLDLIYKEIDNDEDVKCAEYVYGFDVEKGEKKESGYEIIAKSIHSCYIRFELFSSTNATLFFKDSSDAEFFQKLAKEYGLLVYENSMFVPKKKMSSGYHYVDSLDWGGEYDPIYIIGRTESENGWHTVSIGIDF